MSLKKYLRSLVFKSGQIAIEYFILLTIIAAFAIVSSSGLFNRARFTAERVTNAAAIAMFPESDDD